MTYYLRLNNCYIYERFSSLKKIKEFLQGDNNANGFIDVHEKNYGYKYAEVVNGQIVQLSQYYAVFTDKEGNSYCLINGWNKHKSFFDKTCSERCLFTDLKTLRNSVSKILKTSAKYDLSYEEDKITIFQIDFQVVNGFRCLKESKVYGDYYE